MKKLFSAIAILLTATGIQAQSLKLPAASPTQTVIQDFATSRITIEYSRPGVKDRNIFGDLVPYDSVWRTGANAPTKIYFGEDVRLDGHDVPMGTYALYTIPGKTSWTIILSKDTALWGAFGYQSSTDLLRFNVKPASIPFVETFQISFANMRDDACDIQLAWDKTMVSFHVNADIDPKIMAQIDAAMSSDKPPYFAAANYYYNHGKDLHKAYEWVTKAVAARPDAYYMAALKAKIEMKLGMKKEALATAQAALPHAQKAHDTGYESQLAHLIELAKQ